MTQSNEQRLSSALHEVGYEFIPQPTSESTSEVQCLWCRASEKEITSNRNLNYLKQQVKHDKDCPVSLATSLIK
jgi:hypothetical protein